MNNHNGANRVMELSVIAKTIFTIEELFPDSSILEYSGFVGVYTEMISFYTRRQIREQ